MAAIIAWRASSGLMAHNAPRLSTGRSPDFRETMTRWGIVAGHFEVALHDVWDGFGSHGDAGCGSEHAVAPEKVDARCVAGVAAPQRRCRKSLVVERVLHAEVPNAERHFPGNVGEQRVILNHLTPPPDLFVVVGVSAANESIGISRVRSWYAAGGDGCRERR